MFNEPLDETRIHIDNTDFYYDFLQHKLLINTYLVII